MPDRPAIGRSLVTRRAIVDIVRGAVLGSYGVTGVDAGVLERLLGRLGFGEPGIRVRLDRGLEIDLHLTVAFGVPVAEVARQVDSAVRYGIRHALDREVRRLAVHVGGLRYQPASVPPSRDIARPIAKDAPAEARPGPAGEPSPPDLEAAGSDRGAEGSADATGDPPQGDGTTAPVSAAPQGKPAGVAGRARRRRGPASDGRSPG